VMASYFDTSAVDSVVDMCKRRKKPYAFLLSAYDIRKTFAAVNKEAVANLKGRGQIIDGQISYDPKYRAGQIEGKAGPEKDAKLRPEVDKVWAEVKKLAKFAESNVVPLKQRGRG
jgi:hypothetical protein